MGNDKERKVYKQYIAGIEALFPIKGKAEKKYINDFKINVLDYCEENHISSIENLNQEFGSPQEVVNTYFSNIDTDYVVKKVRFAKWMKIILTGILLVAIVTAAIYSGMLILEYIAFLEEQVVMTDAEQSGGEYTDSASNIPEYTSDIWKKYSTITKYISLPVGEGQYIDQYYSYMHPYSYRPFDYVVLPDCRVAILDRIGLQVLICDADENVVRVKCDNTMINIWQKNGRVYLSDLEGNVYVVNEYGFLDLAHNETVPMEDYGSLKEMVLENEDTKESSIDILKVAQDGTFYTHEYVFQEREGRISIENVIRQYDANGNKKDYAYYDDYDCPTAPEHPAYIDDNGNIWLMLCRSEYVGIYLVTLGNSDISISDKVASMIDSFDDFKLSFPVDCTEEGLSLEDFKGKYTNSYTYDRTQIELSKDTRFITTTKTLNYKNEYNDKLLELTVTATFAYDGVIARCISVAPDAKTFAAGWTIEKYYTSNDVGMATVTAVFIHDGYLGGEQSYTSSLTIYCGPNGTIH